MRLECSETALSLFAKALACTVRRGDVIALYGDLGAGKTTFCRYLITAILGHEEEIPSPTFSLVQTYDGARMPIAHFDLYRLSDASEMYELGFDDAVAQGLALVEWPQRAGDTLPAHRLELHLSETNDPARRHVELIGHGEWAARLARFEARQGFLKSIGWADAAASYMQGDASPRAYIRLQRGKERRILMDAPAMRDGPVVANGKSYSALAHLAEDVTPFVAVGNALRAGGISTPEIFAADLAQGFLLLEDLGDKVFGAQLEQDAGQGALWRRAVDVLAALRGVPLPDKLPLPGGSSYVVPRFDLEAMQIEVELLLDWYWPALHGSQCPLAVRQDFLALWRPIFERLQNMNAHWLLRDYHSPNLLSLEARPPPADIGVIDFQDALRGPAAYDLVSLLQDARVDVSHELERDLLNHYCARVSANEPDFDRAEFMFAYGALGLQRNTKVLGIFARLARRDGKRQYLAHIPRNWQYLSRNLQHHDLAPLKAWYDMHFPAKMRGSLAGNP